MIQVLSYAVEEEEVTCGGVVWYGGVVEYGLVVSCSHIGVVQSGTS